MRYSVWQSGPRRYDYYETSAPEPHSTPQPSLPKTELGVASTVCAPFLPAGAKKTGDGVKAQGTIARLPGGAGLGDLPPIASAVGLALVAWAAWKVLR